MVWGKETPAANKSASYGPKFIKDLEYFAVISQ